MNRCVHIGSGAGFAGDRFDAAVPVVATLANRDGPRYLIYEVMGERTLAIAQRIKRQDPDKGYSPWLENYLPHVLADCMANDIRIVANFGNANPAAAGRKVLEIAKQAGLASVRVAIVEGDDLLSFMQAEQLREYAPIEGTDTAGRALLAANAYLGARPVADALALGADIVLVGRSTDAALVLGPLIHEYGWRSEQYDLLAAGTLAGHLLECGAQVTGAYFADPGFKDVEGLESVGFPIAEITADGVFVIGKAEGTGGLVSRATVIEQMLYEMHDPSAYLTPDVTLDITAVELADDGADRIRVSGARGHAPPTKLKATLSVDGGWLGEAEISYAGPNALARAKLAVDVVRDRYQRIGIDEPCRIEIIGTGSVFDDDSGTRMPSGSYVSDAEYRLRAAVRCDSQRVAQRAVDEVLALYCCGPAAGGGVRQSVSAQVSTASILIDRTLVEPHTRAVEVTA